MGVSVYREGLGWRCDYDTAVGPRCIPIIGEIEPSRHHVIIETVRREGGDQEAMRTALELARA